MKRTMPMALPALVLAAVGLTASPAAASDPEVPFKIARIQAATPQCDHYPEYGVVGRVSGVMGSPRGRTIGFVGCFPSYAACDAWRGPVSGQFDGRLILNSCEPRW